MKKILFIEDEGALQKLISQKLEKSNFQILNALNGEIGLQKAIEQNPDLILLDLVLPKKDGFQVLQELKQNKQTKNIPVIILSNLENSSDIQKALALGATTYLVKASYKLDEVIQKIKKEVS